MRRYKRISIRGKYKLVLRDRYGRFKRIKAYKLPKKRLKPVSRLKKSVLSQKTIKRFNKKDTISKELISRNTGVSEIVSKKAVRGKRAVMQVKFVFFKEKREAVKITSRSNKLPPSRRRTAFNQCYQRALAQIDFSPLSYAILEITYIYWEK